MQEKKLDRINYEIVMAAIRYGHILKPECLNPKQVICNITKMTSAQYDLRMQKTELWGIFQLCSLVKAFDNQFAEYIRENFPIK